MPLLHKCVQLCGPFGPLGFSFLTYTIATAQAPPRGMRDGEK